MENTAIPPCEIRPYDHLWDMYYDEFENEEENDELKNDLPVLETPAGGK